MSRFSASALTLIALGLGVGLILQHQARTRLSSEILSLRSEVAQLAEQVASLQKENTRAPISEVQPAAAPLPENQLTELARLRADLNLLRERLAQLELAWIAMSNQLASANGANDPFIYPDSRRKKDYAFSGYAAPQSALQSLLWAMTQSDAKTFKASLAPEMTGAFAAQFQDLPEGVMPGGFKNGAMYQASGYRVLEETALPNEETRLKVFLEGKPKIAVKLVFKRVGDEWKWARNE